MTAGDIQSVVSGRRRRRTWSADEKRQILAETLEPGASMSVVARRHDVNANMLFTWRRQAEAGLPSATEPPMFLPAAITDDAASASEPLVPDVPGRMEIVLPGGERVIVGTDVDGAALAHVLKALARR